MTLHLLRGFRVRDRIESKGGVYTDLGDFPLTYLLGLTEVGAARKQGADPVFFCGFRPPVLLELSMI